MNYTSTTRLDSLSFYPPAVSSYEASCNPFKMLRAWLLSPFAGRSSRGAENDEMVICEEEDLAPPPYAAVEKGERNGRDELEELVRLQFKCQGTELERRVAARLGEGGGI